MRSRSFARAVVAVAMLCSTVALTSGAAAAGALSDVGGSGAGRVQAGGGPAGPSDAVKELRRARAAMLVPEEAPYAGVLDWRKPRPDRVQPTGDVWDEASHPCRLAGYADLGGEAFRNGILVSETVTTYDASAEQDVLLFPDTATAEAAYDALVVEAETCQERLAEQGSDLPVTHVGDLTDGGRGTVWDVDFGPSEPEFLGNMTLAVVQRGRAVGVVVVDRYNSLPTYDPAAVLPTAQAALRRLALFDRAA